MSHFDEKGSPFEEQSSSMNVVKENFIMQFLSLIPLEITNVIAREPEILTNDYEYAKNLLFKRFKMKSERFK